MSSPVIRSVRKYLEVIKATEQSGADISSMCRPDPETDDFGHNLRALKKHLSKLLQRKELDLVLRIRGENQRNLKKRRSSCVLILHS
ncbi:hypothetical protein R1flu_014035 [Riccia fluitans]|uniref:Uncharacterized protein n=1 Tax=Riccia fluitans TaxID=41844 RepID=A0ABD1YIF1_9MARC